MSAGRRLLVLFPVRARFHIDARTGFGTASPRLHSQGSHESSTASQNSNDYSVLEPAEQLTFCGKSRGPHFVRYRSRIVITSPLAKKIDQALCPSALPSNEGVFALNNVNLFLLELHDVSCPWSAVDVLEELLQSIFRALSFPLHLAWSASSRRSWSLFPAPALAELP
jgi:hypothetical protein